MKINIILPDQNIEVTTSMVKEFTKSFIIGCRGDLFSKMPKKKYREGVLVKHVN